MKVAELETTPSKKIHIYAKSSKTETLRVYVEKPVFYGGTNDLNWFSRKCSSFSKQTVVLHPSFLMAHYQF